MAAFSNNRHFPPAPSGDAGVGHNYIESRVVSGICALAPQNNGALKAGKEPSNFTPNPRARWKCAVKYWLSIERNFYI